MHSSHCAVCLVGQGLSLQFRNAFAFLPFLSFQELCGAYLTFLNAVFYNLWVCGWLGYPSGVVMVSAVFTWTVITQSIYLSFSVYICCERPELMVSLRCGFWSTSVSIMLCLLSTMKHTAKTTICPFSSAQVFPSALYRVLVHLLILYVALFVFLFVCFMFFEPLENRLWQTLVSTEGLPNLMDFRWIISPIVYYKLKTHSLLIRFLWNLPESPSSHPLKCVTAAKHHKPHPMLNNDILFLELPNNCLEPSHFRLSFCFCWAW